MNFTLSVNGQRHAVDVEPATPLLYVLRNDVGLHGPRFGCGLGQCGACTVIIKGEAVRSCIRPMSAVPGAEVTTLEGLAKNGVLHPIQQAWIDEQVPQCGFCQNGQIMTAKALLDRTPNPTDAQIRQGMAGIGQRGARMTAFTNVPKSIEDILERRVDSPSRRDFLRHPVCWW